MTRGECLVAIGALASLTSSCIYDHRVTQQIIERRRAAKEAEGSQIHAAPANNNPGAMRSGRLRFYVAKGFVEQHRDWQHAVSSLADAANGVVGSSFKLRFEVAASKEWSPACDQE